MFHSILKKLNALRVVFWLVVVALCTIALFIQVQNRLSEAAANVAALARGYEEIRHPVTTITIEPTVWESWRSYFGQTQAARTQIVAPCMREVVQAVHVQVGDTVRRGDTVVTLLQTDHIARAQASQTTYEEARLNYNRLRELNIRGGVPNADVDRAYSLMRTAEANAQANRSTLQRTQLRSSIDGVVSARRVEPGELTEAGRALMTIIDPTDIEAQLMVSRRDINSISRDTQVELILDGIAKRGQVVRISPEAQSGSGLYPVVVSLGANSGIRPGTYLEGRFLVNRQENVIVIPSHVVMFRRGSQFVHVVRGDRVELVEITIGEGRNEQVIVTSGLRAGDQLVISGNRTLSDGALVSRSEVAGIVGAP